MKKLTLIFFLFFILYSCSSNTPTKKEQPAVQNNTNLYTETHPNGQIKIKGHLIKDKRQGTWTSYYENGNIWSETNYQSGVKTGETKSFYPNGNLRYLGYYENDKQAHQWFFYSENGQFEKEVDFSEKK